VTQGGVAKGKSGLVASWIPKGDDTVIDTSPLCGGVGTIREVKILDPG